MRLLALQVRRPLAEAADVRRLDTHEILQSAYLLTNIEAIHALSP